MQRDPIYLIKTGYAGTWRSRIVAHIEEFIKVSSDIRVDVAATMFVNPPTAYRMMKDFVDLQPGIYIAKRISARL